MRLVKEELTYIYYSLDEEEEHIAEMKDRNYKPVQFDYIYGRRSVSFQKTYQNKL